MKKTIIQNRNGEKQNAKKSRLGYLSVKKKYKSILTDVTWRCSMKVTSMQLQKDL